jgi:hypothetical protein
VTAETRTEPIGCVVRDVRTAGDLLDEDGASIAPAALAAIDACVAASR